MTSSATPFESAGSRLLSTSDIERLKREFDEEGYVVVRGAVTKPGLSALRDTINEEYERLKRNGELFEGGGTIAGHLNSFPGEGARFVYEDLERQGLIDLVRAVNPEQAKALRVACNWNLPGSVAQNYHRDGSFEPSFLVLNVAVVDTDLVNGAIDVIPRTHLRPLEYWQFVVERLYRKSLRVPMQQGDVLLRKSTLWHRGMPNKSRAPRPMLGLTFGEGCASTGDPFREHEGKVAFWANRFPTNFAGRLRERSYVALPIAHSALRLALSVMGRDAYKP